MNEFAVAIPVPENILLKSFGTTKPTLTQMQNRPSNFMDFIDSIGTWEAVYVLLYDENDEPSKIMFEGWSGD
jgi:hypothetical protein